MVTIYRDINFQGIFSKLEPGFYSGQNIRGYKNKEAYSAGEDISGDIKSIRIDENYIAALYCSLSPTAQQCSRVFIGPTEIPDLNAHGFTSRILSIQVFTFKRYNSGAPRNEGVTLFSDYARQGLRSFIQNGDYNSARLQSEEIKLSSGFRSLIVDNHVLAILYEGHNYDGNAVITVGPTYLDDLESIGLFDKVKSIKVLYTDPNDLGFTKSLLPITSSRLTYHDKYSQMNTLSVQNRPPKDIYNKKSEEQIIDNEMTHSPSVIKYYKIDITSIIFVFILFLSFILTIFALIIETQKNNRKKTI